MNLSHDKKHPQQMNTQGKKNPNQELLFKFKVFCKERNSSAIENIGPNPLPSGKHISVFSEVAQLLPLSDLDLCPCLMGIKSSIKLSLQ